MPASTLMQQKVYTPNAMPKLSPQGARAAARASGRPIEEVAPSAPKDLPNDVQKNITDINNENHALRKQNESLGLQMESMKKESSVQMENLMKMVSKLQIAVEEKSKKKFSPEP